MAPHSPFARGGCLCEGAPEVAAGTVDPQGHGPPRAAESCSCLALAETVPGDQQERLELNGWQLRERGQDRVSLLARRGVIRCRRAHGLRSTFEQRLSSPVAAPLVRKDPSRDPDQPRQGLGRQISPSSPGDLKRPRQRVGGRRAIGPREQVRSDALKVLVEEDFEAFGVRSSSPPPRCIWFHMGEVAGRSKNVTRGSRIGERVSWRRRGP